jgi:hypothetical protein
VAASEFVFFRARQRMLLPLAAVATRVFTAFHKKIPARRRDFSFRPQRGD